MRRSFRYILLSLGGILLLLLLALAALMLLNQRDEPLDPATQAWLDWQLPQPPEQENGYLALYALESDAAAPLQAAGDVHRLFSDIAQTPYAGRSARYDQALARLQLRERQYRLPEGVCGKGRDCVADLRQHAALLAERRTEFSDELARYRQMLQMPGYAELLTDDLNAPFPRISPVINLWKLNASALIAELDSGNGEAALSRWLADQRFWLKAASGSRTLINLMVAASHLRKNLQVLDTILQNDPSTLSARHAEVAELLKAGGTLQPLLGQALIGETQLGAAMLLPPPVGMDSTTIFAKGNEADVLLGREAPDVPPEWLAGLIIQRNASINLLRQSRAQQAQLHGIPLPAGLTLGELPVQPVCPASSWQPINPAGKILVCIAEVNWGDYAARLKTIEQHSQRLLAQLPTTKH